MLPNLNEVAIDSQQRYLNEFTANELVLTESFKNAFRESLNREQRSVDFTAHTAVVTTSGNLKMYIPNQWFCAAAYMVPFVRVYLQYKRYTDEFFADVYPANQERKEIVKALKEQNNADLIDRFRAQMSRWLRGRVDQDELDEDVQLLTAFVSNYQWWYGSKTIDRGDSYVSPVLSLLGVVNASQGYIAEICYKFATEPWLSAAAEEMIERYPAEVNAVDTDEEPAREAERLTGGTNVIVYGAPGTGKSRYLNDTYGRNANVSRVVFHPEYTTFDFVGTYKPVPVYRDTEYAFHTENGTETTTGEPHIDYRFVPGPFINCLVNAWLDPAHMHTLIIEEINRANTAAVFGEVFQLLDRDIGGCSEYGIEPGYDLKQYLTSINGMDTYIRDGLRIPSNMNIVATMNSADQGVMPMDSAFKRRWSFVYTRIAIEGAIHENARFRYAGRETTWGGFLRAVNTKLVALGLDEDRLIGPYFIKPEEIGNRLATDKLLLYLWDDVLRHRRASFFNNQVKTFADLSVGFSVTDVFDLFADPDTAAMLNTIEILAENIEDEDDIETNPDIEEN